MKKNGLLRALREKFIPEKPADMREKRKKRAILSNAPAAGRKFLNPLSIFEKSDAFYLLAFFLVVISIGAVLLLIPGMWAGEGGLRFTDAFFTASSAVCVAGLGTVDTSAFSPAGQIVILFLIQVGGLGIISFSSLILTISGNRLGLNRRNTIRGFYLDGVEYRPRRIVRNIIAFTLLFETAGAVALSLLFRHYGEENWLFMGIFHAVSAFCNTGISLFSGGLKRFALHIPIIVTLMSLIMLGGVGFLVLNDVIRFFAGKTKRLQYHTKVILAMTLVIVAVSSLFFIIFERNRLYAGMSTPVALMNAVFQSTNTRSGGFEIVVQSSLSQPSKLLTALLMLIGGAPGSIAGGLKITTVFVLFAFLFCPADKDGDVKIFKRRLTAESINKAVVYTFKALILLSICITALTISEGIAGKPFGAIAFEVFSAFATVGLSLGITGDLSTAGKWIIIGAMFAGRVGLIALAFPALVYTNPKITYPKGALLME
jgi:trk system potassium uptake protein TrkH